jgi:hypothetical protein
MGRACNTNGKEANASRLLMGKRKGKNPPGRPRCRLVDNIELDVRET